MITTGKIRVGTRDESYVDSDEFIHDGKNYKIRVTALYPYKDFANGGDELYCNLDYKNVVTGESGRFEKVWIEARNLRETDGHLRRHSAYRTLRRLLTAAGVK